MNERLTWNEYFLDMCRVVASRAACTRRQVGAVIVNSDHRVIATGYNGAPAGAAECTDGACPRGQRTDEEVASLSPYVGAGACIAIHAEDNALQQLSSQKVQDLLFESTIFVNYKPCEPCLSLILKSGVRWLVYRDSTGHIWKFGLNVFAQRFSGYSEALHLNWERMPL